LGHITTCAISDLFLKHPDATLATYVRRQMKQLEHASKILAKTHEKHLKTIANHMQQPDTTLATYVSSIRNIPINTLATYV
jgi:hypothetical protein